MKDNGEIVKRYVHKDKLVFIIKMYDKYFFKIHCKGSKQDIFSAASYDSLTLAEKDSYKVAKCNTYVPAPTIKA